MASNKKELSSFLKYDGKKQVISGGNILSRKKPKHGKWQQSQGYECCDPYLDRWRVVDGGNAGDGTATLISGVWYIVGPNDSEDDGWVYVKKYFRQDTTITIDYSWDSLDSSPGIVYDRPVYFIAGAEPITTPSDITPRATFTPEIGTWTITIPADNWFGVGVYSTDSCCGRGYLNITINE